MGVSSHNIELDISKLKQFHVSHFPGQPVPSINSASLHNEVAQSHDSQLDNLEEEDELGYYEDGVKRKLTDEQIDMFRHSEIQRLLAARRRDAEAKEAELGREGGSENTRRPNLTHQRGTENNPKRTNSELNRASGTGKRKSQFSDEPQDENADVVLEY